MAAETARPGAAPRTMHVVVMGVSGSGKTTVARGVARAAGLLLAEADDFHPVTNVDKMRGGIPLTDEDRWPWLGELAGWMADRAREGVSTVITCSALRRAYRDVLAAGPPSIHFVHLRAPTPLIHERLAMRVGHYMPPSLLGSQVEALEPLDDDEPGVVVDVSGSPDEVLARALRSIAGLSGPRGSAPPARRPPDAPVRAARQGAR
ncbi:gluconokinase [Actinotalea sp. Marseille-Q4924]|uniref:gluconokinase n=1 Tax=Actinotalea sp. Marseille-Q4924 TaxID=2866571 RepID=UPI001CE45D21|nr:gluconokinase [Actinotalea sp. Marseille-Q4924]